MRPVQPTIDVLAAAAAAAAVTLCACGTSRPSAGPIDAAASAGDGAAGDGAAQDGGSPADAETSDSPNLVPGECVYQGAVWYCGAGYGTFQSCPGASYPDLGTSCYFDSGVCFGCTQGVGETFGCVLGSYTVGEPVGTDCNH